MHNTDHNHKRALVISGGGCKGAFAGGIAEYLLNHCGHDYKIFVGTSAGSLLVPLLALGETERIKKVFTSIRQRNIFNLCPFIIRKRRGSITYSINYFNMLRQFLQGKKTFGESKSLRKLIRRTFTLDDYQRLRASDKEVIVTVSNLSCLSVEYYSVHDSSYEDFCDWMWISSNLAPFMSLVIKNGMEYADGGYGNYLPLRYAILKGACEVDAIILNPKERNLSCQLPVTNAFGLLLRTFDYMLERIGIDDIDIGNIESQARQVQLNSFHTPRVLTENSFIFEPKQMKGWWEEGYRYAMETAPFCQKIGEPESTGLRR